MSYLELGKLIDCIEEVFVILLLSDPNYDTVLQEQKTANTVIRTSLEKNIISQHSGYKYNQDTKKLWLVLQATYDQNLVLNSDHVQEQILNLRLKYERLIAEFVGTLRQLYREVAMCRRSASLMDIFNTLTRPLPSNGEAIKHQLQSTINAESRHYVEIEEILWFVHDLEYEKQILLSRSAALATNKVETEFLLFESKVFVLDIMLNNNI